MKLTVTVVEPGNKHAENVLLLLAWIDIDNYKNNSYHSSQT